MTLRVAIYIFPDVEVLDFAGPFEVFTTATRVHGRRNPGLAPPFTTFTVAKTSEPVKARAGLVVTPDYSLASSPRPDVLLVPGGIVDQQLQDVAVLDWLAQASRSASVTASICTGSFILAKLGLLCGKTATTHWEDIADLRNAFPNIVVREDVRWVDEGAVVSSAGIAAGIDMSLHLVARLVDAELAKASARQMDVPYRSEP